VLELDDGIFISESTAITECLDIPFRDRQSLLLQVRHKPLLMTWCPTVHTVRTAIVAFMAHLYGVSPQ
jgi:hypothetical protein